MVFVGNPFQLRSKVVPLAVILLASALALVAAASAQTGAKTTLVSVSSARVQGNSHSYLWRGISANGRFVAFESVASNLVRGDGNAASDVFVRDRKADVTRRISVSSTGAEGSAGSYLPAISADGRFVAFVSTASNLVPGDANGSNDVFVRDRKTGTTKRVSVSSAGAEGNAGSDEPAISADGRFVTFESLASNLVSGDENSVRDVFTRDRKTGTTKRMSVSSAEAESNAGGYGPAISADGRFVAFSSDASNLVAGDSNGYTDIFVRDRKTGATKRVSVASAGAQGNSASAIPSISASGRFVAFQSNASNLVAGDANGDSDVFVRDRKTGTTRRVSMGSASAEGNSSSALPAMSASGRFVAFYSNASNLVRRDTNAVGDIFVRDRRTGTTRRVSVSSAGVQANANSGNVAISADGRFVAFETPASNLVARDTNGASDVFVRGPLRWR